MDRGQHHAVARVVEERERPRQVPAQVAERVVADHREVTQRVAGLGAERRDLLAQAVHVLGQRVGAGATAYGRLAPERDHRQARGRQRDQERDDVEDPHDERA